MFAPYRSKVMRIEYCSIGEQVDGLSKQSWYVLRTFSCKEQKVSRFLTGKGIAHFIPMTLRAVKSKDNEQEKRYCFRLYIICYLFGSREANSRCFNYLRSVLTAQSFPLSGF